MELSQIRYFIETAKMQHITKSAQRLSIAQPALTKSIHNLERELGMPLFVRKGRNIVLTPCGKYLSEKLEPIINSLDSIPKELEKIAQKEKCTVRLAVLAASTIVTRAIIDYKKQNPNVNFHVIQNPDSELFDIEVTTNLFYNNNDRADNLFVCTERIFLAVPDTEKYKNRHSVDLAEMKDEGFISLFGSKQLRSICDKFCFHAGFEPKIIFDSDSPEAVKNMIGANMGVGFWPEFTWGEMKNNRIKLLEIKKPVCRRDILVTLKNAQSESAYAEDFFEFLKEYFENKKTSVYEVYS